MLNLFQHPFADATLKQVQGDLSDSFTLTRHQ